MCRIGLLVFWAVLVLAETPSRTASVEQLLEDKLMERLRRIEAATQGVLGVAVVDLTANRTIHLHGQSVFPQASSIKIPILVEVFQSAREKRLRLDDLVTLQASESVGGSGHLRILLRSGPLQVTVRSLASAMIETSDNSATNRLISLLGMDRVNAHMQRLGLGETRLRRIMLDSAAARRGDENVSTPLEMSRLVEMIYRGKAVDAEASEAMIGMLKLVDADFRAAVPSGVAVASKPGELTGVRCETGLIYAPNRPFVLSVMSTFLREGENPVRDVARVVYEHFAALGVSNTYGNRVH